METIFDQAPVAVAPKRPTFLLVLCILTFIGSGWGIISSAITYATANTTAALMQKSKEDISALNENGSSLGSSFMSGLSVFSDPARIRMAAVFQLVSCLFTLAGAILMFRLRKAGFYIYVLGILVYIIGPLVAYGTSNLWSLIAVLWQGFIGILFIVLYGLNLKAMR